MKTILMAAAGLALLAAPVSVSAQSRGHGGGGFHGGGGGGFSGGGARSGGGFRGEAVATRGGGYQGARAYGGYRGGYRGYGYRGGYGWRGGYGYGYYGFGLGLAFGLDYGFGYPWYYAYPAYAYVPTYYDAGYVYGDVRDDRTRPSEASDTQGWPFNDRVGQGPAPSDTRGGPCGRWVWDPAQSQYHWTEYDCAAGG